MTDKQFSLRKAWIPIGKTGGEFSGLLATSSLDRDNEIISPELIKQWAKRVAEKPIPILLDHENKVESNVGEWINPQVVEKDGKLALQVTPKFFLSNPKAAMMKGMLEEGAQMGLSVGFMPTDSVDKKVEGETFMEFTEGELVEGSFTPVPANRMTYMNVAKAFGLEYDIPCSADCAKEIQKQRQLAKRKESEDSELITKEETKMRTKAAHDDMEEEKAVPSLREGEQEAGEALDAPIERKRVDMPDEVEPKKEERMVCPEGYRLEGDMCKLNREEEEAISEDEAAELGQEGSKSFNAQIRKAMADYNKKHAKEIEILTQEINSLKRSVKRPVRKALVENWKPVPAEKKLNFKDLIAAQLGVKR